MKKSFKISLLLGGLLLLGLILCYIHIGNILHNVITIKRVLDLDNSVILSSVSDVTSHIELLENNSVSKIVLSGPLNSIGFKTIDMNFINEVSVSNSEQIVSFPNLSDSVVLKLLKNNKYVYCNDKSRLSYDLDGGIVEEFESYELLGLNIPFWFLYNNLSDSYESNKNTLYGYKAVKEFWDKSYSDYNQMGNKQLSAYSVYGDISDEIFSEITPEYNQNDFDMLVSNASTNGASIIGTLSCVMSKDALGNISIYDATLYIGHLKNIQEYINIISVVSTYYWLVGIILLLLLVCTRFFGLLKYVDKRGGYSK